MKIRKALNLRNFTNLIEKALPNYTESAQSYCLKIVDQGTIKNIP